MQKGHMKRKHLKFVIKDTVGIRKKKVLGHRRVRTRRVEVRVGPFLLFFHGGKTGKGMVGRRAKTAQKGRSMHASDTPPAHSSLQGILRGGDSSYFLPFSSSHDAPSPFHLLQRRG